MQPNDKIKYIGASQAQVEFGGHDDPRELLKENEIYTVSDVEVHSWHTNIILDEFPDKQFNSVCFEEV